MKAIVVFLNCVKGKIKNKFFKEQNQDKVGACEQWKKFNDELSANADQPGIEEYLTTYRFTTRWQTL